MYLDQDESLNAKILKKICFYFMFFLRMFSVSFENENITSKPFTYIGKNKGATALFFTVSLGPKNLFFLFFLLHAHTMTNLKNVAHSICQTWYRILKIVVLNT